MKGEGPAALSEAGLVAWGEALGAEVAGWAGFVALYGPLGAGKTTLVQAACRGAGVEEPVTSPSYALVHRYRGGRGFVHHVDLYRLAGPEELVEVGWEDLLGAEEPVFVEWADRAAGWLPEVRWDVRLWMGEDASVRVVEAVPRGGAPRLPDLPAPVRSGSG